MRDIQLGNQRIPGTDQIIVDLYLKYGEQPANGQRPLFRGACADVEACEPSRLLERPVPKLVARTLSSPYDELDTSDDEITRLTKAYADLTKRLDALFANADPRTLSRRLSTWQLHSACLVRDYVRSLSDLNSEIIARIRSWLQLDWLMHEALCECRPCRTDDGVRLARLWLWRKDGRADCCRPLEIIGVPPFRRLLQRDCAPGAASKSDLRRWVGGRLDDVIARMELEGIHVQDPMEVTNSAPLQAPLFSIAPTNSVRPRFVMDWFDEKRIIGFDNP